ncbi:Fe(3+)-hydroxamate ABC transporter permease FhuB [Rhizobium sp. BK376]|uniref:Fe(3+)-hydroxamate ABC transporter permease FhuB n=1 Tax=Rhizobium sp. BK376 TaxID=2512149 RepID=UPI00104D7EF9|nr:Fe(3+)-hydroxamate ABC transporter permease FhuB [Rhizobium sp. BK376]TCR72265.1 iron complex transport system permease protein [Rhizobium sp. BK376]
MDGTVSRLRVPAGSSLIPAGLALLTLCVLALGATIALRPQLPGGGTDIATLDNILLWDSLLPRGAIALIAGGAIGLSGVLLQRVLRNPIADASTLGIAAGAQLALTVSIGFFPVLLGFSRELVAFAGGLIVLGLVIALSWRRGLEPITVALSGMVMTLIAAALSVTIVLARGEYAMSIYIWGAGALNQQSWSGVIALAPQLAIGLAAAGLLLRPLAIMGLDDGGARSLGVALHSTRFAILALAVWLSAAVTAEVGIIGFLGFAAPTIARLAGARRTGQLLIAAPVTGAGLLLLTDCAVQLLSPGFVDLAPAGAATALLGGPLLIFLLPRLHSAMAVQNPSAPYRRRPLRSPGRILVLMLLAAFALFLLSLAVGRTSAGWQIAMGQPLTDLLPFRLPRTVVAAAAGAMLAAAGFLLQRLTGNPLASPEVLGVSSGGGVGLTAALFLFAFPSPTIMLIAMALGALVAILVILAISARSGFGPERLLMAGVAIGALSMATVTIVLSRGDMRGYILLTWMSGSTDRVGRYEAWTAAVAALVLIAPLPILSRWLSILPLGGSAAGAVGLGVTSSRLVLAILAALLTAIPSFLIGPLSLTGLIAPHLARLIGFHRPQHQLAASLLLGGILLVIADWLSRVAIYPYQIPVGLFAALIGGPYLIWHLTRKETSQ